MNNGGYKVMGMAPYGKPSYVDKIYNNIIKVASNGSFWINMDYFSYHYSDERTFNSKFEDLFGKPRNPEMNFFTSDTRFPSYFGEKPSNYPEAVSLRMPDGSYEDIKRKDIYRTHRAGFVFRIIRNTGIGLMFNFWERKSNYYWENRNRGFIGAYVTYEF